MDGMVKRAAPVISVSEKESRSRAARKRALRRVLVVAAALVTASVLVASFAGPALVVSRPLANPDAIVSLGSHEWERLPLAARLAAAHPDAVVILTDPPTPTRFNCHDCAHRVDRLRAMGVAEARVRTVPLIGSGTFGEAQAVLALARHSNIRRLMVVTSPYHTRRSLALFQHVFAGTGVAIGVEGAIVDPPLQPSWWWLAPYDRAYVPYEWAAIVYYAWEYSVPLRPQL